MLATGVWRGLRCPCGSLFAMLLALVLPAAQAQVPEALQAPAPAAPPVELPATGEVPAVPAGNEPGAAEAPSRSLEAFVDGVVAAYMANDHIAGATVAVVDRDRVLMAKGYGVAGLDPPKPVDPASTLFRIGSISKTFTYVAAMQLVARGQLGLDADTNQYLPPSLAIPDEGFGRVTVENLMTHSAGFEDSELGHLFSRGPGGVPTLDAYLAKYRPHRVRPPGQHAVYSNYSVALLGALVAQVSGESFETYVEKHELEPLGDTGVTFREPLAEGDPRRIAPARDADFSTGFRREDGGYTAQPFEYISNMAPAGAGSATAIGMSRWMRMLLGHGSVDGATILDAATFDRMATVDFRNADAVSGIAHGFFRHRYGKYTSLEHGGATGNFLSNMVVLPDAGLGVFISTNTDTGRPLVMVLPRLLFEHLLPDARTATTPLPALPEKELERYAGTYRSERRPYSTLEKFFIAIGSDTTVGPGPNGTLVVDAGEGAHRYGSLGDGAFRNLDDGSTIAFKPAADGTVTTLATGYGHVVADRIGFIDKAATLGAAIAAVALLSIGILIGGWKRRSSRQRVRDGRAASGWLAFAAVIWLAWIIVAGVALAQAANSAATLIFDYPGAGIRTAVVLAYVAAAATIVAVLTIWPALRARDWSIGRKFRHAVVALVMLFAVVLLVRWNVLFAPLSLG